MVATVCAAAAPAAAVAADLGCPVDSALVLFGIAGGAQHVDLPQWDHPADDIGTRSRVAFELGVLVRRWFEPRLEVAFAYLGGSDSLDAALVARGSNGASLGTLVQLQAGARLRWARCGRVQPFVHGGGGVARVRLAAPDEPDITASDPIWSAGAGTEVWLHRRVVARAEASYVRQATGDGTRSHFVGQVGVAWAFARAIAVP